MARKIEVEIIGDSSSYQRALGKATDTSSGFGSSLLRMGRMAAIGFAAVGVGAAVGAARAISAASDLGESINAVNVVFGRSSDKILEWGETAATSAGLSARAFNEAVTPIGAQLQNMGFNADKAADSSIALAQRAADLASVFNTDLDTALEAIRAGLRGEQDPLEKFGVGLSEAAIQSYAVEHGIAAAGAEMSDQQKTVARLGLFFEQTNKVAGDFANTSGGLANQSRILHAEFENLEAQLGEALMPAAIAVMGVLIDLVPVVSHLANRLINALGPAVQSAADAVQSNSGRIMAVFNAVRAVIVEHVIPAFNQLRHWVTTVVQRVAAVLEEHRPELTQIWEDVQSIMQDVVHVVRNQIGPALSKAIPEAIDKAIPAIALLISAVANLVSWLRSAIDGITDLENRLHMGGGLLDILSGIPGGNTGLIDMFKAGGGPITAGRPYIVGENGPEMIVPRSGGTVIPNGRLATAGGGGSVNVIVLGGDREAIDYLRGLDIRSSRRSGRGLF